MEYRTARVGRKRRSVFEAVAALDAVCFPEDGPPTWEQFKTGQWWLVRHKGATIGFASAVHIGDTIVLTRAGIHPDHRGRNLQRRLIDHRVVWARSSGADKAITYTSTDNPASSNNLIAVGFRVFSPETWPTDEALRAGGRFICWRLRLTARL